MILIDNTCISDDIEDQQFVCNLDKCKGACCVEGDSGAPLDEDELAILDEIYPHVAPYLTEAGKAVIAKEGTYTKDWDGDYVTPVINGRECAYATYDKKGILKCGIEDAYNDGKISYKKPISCHLYPIRVTKYEQYHALNYDRWEICSPACSFGKELKVPVYKFLKEPLIRAYGEGWYEQLTQEIDERQEARSREANEEGE
ncbi:DUF3109 family protein [Dyadobacter pollutisoli]|jgi:hypothetical protein|uniref:DUF3109 family protein n=1 Tax=Dyadobacter pollutisoli TaxID=2910158 RepID=A0A9E8NB86_9BACT|nr:DUF3109 family protein [Dyadobacter pollutisoli]WAC12133.1 DUF3109 family protein [Dyadobacter pollutisoli]